MANATLRERQTQYKSCPLAIIQIQSTTAYPDPRLLLLIVSINDKLITEVGDLFTSPEFLQENFPFSLNRDLLTNYLIKEK
jgi:hypothetical protein